MRKGTDIIGKPVVSFDTGEQFEKIHDLVFDQHNNELLGFVVDEGGWFSTTRVLPLSSVQAIGPDTIIVPSKKVIIDSNSDQRFRSILTRNNILKGTKIVTTDGRDLGTLTDLYFDEHTGTIEGYEASGGLFADSYTGRSFIPAPQTLKIGEDVAFVPPETADLMQEHVGGIKGAVQEAGATVAEKAGDAQDALVSPVINSAVDPTKQREWVLGKTASQDVEAPNGMLLVTQGQQVTPLVREQAERQGVLDKLYRATGGSLTAGSQEGTASRALEHVQGRRVTRPVRTGEGLMIAAPGQIVTEQVINRARTYHAENDLLAATGLGVSAVAGNQISNTSSNAKATTQQAADSLKQGTQNVKQGATGLWEKVKEKVSGAQEQAAEKLEEQRINAALGRPTDRVILDPQDNVILNAGELITHHAIKMARDANVLDMLLSSVADVKPEISPESLKADHPGEASLDAQEHTHPGPAAA